MEGVALESMRSLAGRALLVGIPPTGLLLAALGCGGGDRYMAAPEAPPPPPMEPMVLLDADDVVLGAKGIAAPASTSTSTERLQDGPPDGKHRPKSEPEPDAEPSHEPEGGGERLRSWFPEAFLWQPLLQTGADGTAALDVRVPDSLTTWRVLALAHDRSGQQAGALHTFQGTLPLYVDPVVPGWLYSGDSLLLPVAAVNTTDEALDASMHLVATGAVRASADASFRLPPAGSDVRSVPLAVTAAGDAFVEVSLDAQSHHDAARRTIPVLPTGKPVVRSLTASLAASRTFELPPPHLADPLTDKIELAVFPGPLAVLGLELERLAAGQHPQQPAYAFALASRLETLASAAGVEVDQALLRRLRIVAWQRIAAQTIAPSPEQATDLLASLGGETEHAQVRAVLPLLVQRVLDGQRADGTWSRQDRSTLQAVLVQTAFAARALPEDQHGPRTRASAAVERHLREVEDGYTAAVLLASGLAEGSTQERLLSLVRESIAPDATTGELEVEVPPTVRNALGQAPTRSELLSWAVLALPADAPERLDLAALLMQGWSGTTGFGAGPAESVALEAVCSTLGNITGEVGVTLSVAGQALAQGTLDPRQPNVPLRLSAPASDGASFQVSSSPAVPGLLFVATRRSYVPWSSADRLSGVEVSVRTSPLSVGRSGVLTLEMSAPSGVSLRVEQPLPSGAVLEDEAEQRAREQGAALEVRSDRLVLTTRAFGAGEVQRLELPVIPAFAGRFHTAPLLVAPVGATGVAHEPAVWTVAAGS